MSADIAIPAVAAPSDSIAGQLEAGRLADALRATTIQLAQRSLAPATLRQVVEAMLAHELGAVARELLQLSGDTLPPEERADLNTRIADAPDGRINWRRADAFAGNFTALVERAPEFREQRAALGRAAAGLHGFRTGAGQVLLSQRPPGQWRLWWPAFTRGVEEPNPLDQLEHVGPMVVVGVADGPVLPELARRTEKILLGYSYPHFIFEPDAARFAAWLHTGDRTALLSDPRMYFCVGPEAATALEELLGRDWDLPMPQQFMNLSGDPQLMPTAQAAVTRATQTRNAAFDKLSAVVRERYAQRDAAYWHARWSNSRGPVLGMTSRFTTFLQYSTADALRAFESIGHKGDLLINADDHHQLSPLTMLARIEATDPDFVLVLDHLAHEYGVMPANLPVLTWAQDPLPNLLNPTAGAKCGPLQFVCGYFRAPAIEKYNYPADRYWGLDIPVSGRIFDNPSPSDSNTTNEAPIDVCFVSNASQTIEAYFAQQRGKADAALHPLMDRIYERVGVILESNTFLEEADVEPLVTTEAETLGLTLPPETLRHLAEFLARRLFDWGRRQQTLGWVADWAERTGRTFKLFGLGWDAHPRLKPFAAGVLGHGDEMRSVYARTRLALQLVPSGLLHQRTFECLGANTLPLIRYSPLDILGLSVDEYRAQRASGSPLLINGPLRCERRVLLPDVMQLMFSSAAEFETQAEHYLNNPEAREATLNAFRSAVREHFTYEAVLPPIMEKMRAYVAEQAAAQ